MILRQLDIPNGITLAALFLSFGVAILAIDNQFDMALLALIYVGLIDMLDGVIARRMRRTPGQGLVGQQLDSLVDLCAFGFAPAILAYQFGLSDGFSILVLGLYLGACAMRLAYFNSTGLAVEGEGKYYTGLPVTYTALFIPLVFTLMWIVPADTMKIIVQILFLVLSMAMVGNFKMRKVYGRWYVILAVGGILLSTLYLFQSFA